VLDNTAPRSVMTWDRGRLGHKVEIHVCRHGAHIDAQFQETQDKGPQSMEREVVLGP